MLHCSLDELRKFMLHCSLDELRKFMLNTELSEYINMVTGTADWHWRSGVH
jgi:hypothetical protein